MTRCVKSTGMGITALYLQMELLVKLLSIGLSRIETATKPLLIANRLSPQAGKSLVIPQSSGCASNVSEVPYE
ncbi:MAG: hypothetical protein R8M11_08125 [Gallionella sp.]